jgi:hypothetical protein
LRWSYERTKERDGVKETSGANSVRASEPLEY